MTGHRTPPRPHGHRGRHKHRPLRLTRQGKVPVPAPRPRPPGVLQRVTAAARRLARLPLRALRLGGLGKRA